MRKPVVIEKASRMINPGVLIAISACDGERATITPCAWHMPISKEPLLLGVALSKKHFSSFAIRKTKEFVINIPDWDILDKILICAKASGREIDKFKEAELTPTKTDNLEFAPMIEECSGNIECKLAEVKLVGDHYLFIGQVVGAYANDAYFTGENWDISRVELIHHLGGDRFYRSRDYIEVVK